DADDIDELRAARPNIVLLAGGVDYGEKTTVVANARRLAAAGLDAPVVYAGNAAARTRVLEAFGERGVEVLCADNVFPDVDVLRVEPVRALIHEVFNKHIVRAPGMARLARLSSAEILPTPGAVLLAAEIFANAVGDAVVVDVGGATTDVHSVTDGSPELANKTLDPEPHAKRTVEGDLGVFVNARRVAELAGGDEASLEHLKAIPGDEREAAVTRWLAERAVQVAIRRHAGSVADLFTPTGKTQVVRGKDLSAVRWVVGTGGALTRVDGGADILRGVCLGAGSNLLPPPEARVLIDRDYRFSALGTVAQAHPDEVAATFKQWVADQSATPSLEED
ncbi:MAG: glutamate mutase L, partial [Propionibacteriaceae bacterium]|nr:glutamate mutase L [Propionibacteriaceae bacterium]